MQSFSVSLSILFAASLAAGQAAPAVAQDIKEFRLGAIQPAADGRPQQNQVPTSPAAATFSYAPMTGAQRFERYLKTTFGPEALIKTAASAGVNQARDTVPEWGQGMEGYARRYGSSFGRRIVKRSIQHGLEALLNQDSRYVPSRRGGILPRTLNAVGQTFVAHTEGGGRTFAYPRFVAAFGSAYVSQQWHPDRYRTFSRGIRTGAITLGIDAAWHVVSEFWPDLRRRIRH